MNDNTYTKEEIKKKIGIKSDTTLRKYIKFGKITITQEFSREKKLYSIGFNPDDLKEPSNNIDLDFSETA